MVPFPFWPFVSGLKKRKDITQDSFVGVHIQYFIDLWCKSEAPRYELHRQSGSWDVRDVTRGCSVHLVTPRRNYIGYSFQG